MRASKWAPLCREEGPPLDAFATRRKKFQQRSGGGREHESRPGWEKMHRLSERQTPHGGPTDSPLKHLCTKGFKGFKGFQGGALIGTQNGERLASLGWLCYGCRFSMRQRRHFVRAAKERRTELHFRSCTQRNLFESLINKTETRLYLPFFRLILNQSDAGLVPNQSENSKCNMISV